MTGVCSDLGIYLSGKLIGKIKISNIVYGVFKSGILGYAIDKDYEGMGYMKESINLILDSSHILANWLFSERKPKPG